ncbi:PAS domain S-box [Desulfosporosinus orientis DSM 765]|uniref:PAS domain S-box n=1 Tax=Desulfosporosinus orientis (strain ATCC 19365 / DSM 765 / NCIMB 8382 / VKM B-1628 / Singapore I) TaxID=768706 RepID=G7WAP9_DESOD|nr:sigma 54-interacting transcriptional regulator [Desulfosporosinus orientis]AET66817.1 PAS domain S-box [Desulfosporosinus orientis DSM 765]
MLNLLDVSSQDFVVCPINSDLEQLINKISGKDIKYIIVYQEDSILGILSVSNLLHEIIINKKTKVTHKQFTNDKLRYEKSFTIISKDLPLSKIKDNKDIVVIVNNENYPLGIIDGECTPDIKQTLLEYQKIFENLEEEIFVTDQHGYVLRLNPAAERVCGVLARDVVGRHVRDLEREGLFSSSITMHVLRQKKKVNMMQQLKSGKTVLSTAIPILNDEGEIVRVISTSKDYQEINKIKAELEEKKTELEEKNTELARKTQELSILRQEIFSNVNLIYKSNEMKTIRNTIFKIAPLALTVLIQGESGVGKEVISKAIHHASPMRDQPFIKINCSLIPEHLIESELFGYESGAFTGATKGGKIGKIELANNGTLFLDEIGEVPLMIQVKLLEFLQDQEICKVGGTKRIKIDTRIIAATNRNLQDMVNDGLFRKDLYYRLNVVPINIPPLRERKEDIPALVRYFLNVFNNKYGMNKIIDPEVMQALYNYSWPGNVRELEHVLERAIVISETELIRLEALQNSLELKGNKRIACPDLMPLKLAKSQLEEQMVRNAYELCKSTYKAAKLLEVDQSTVVKLLKKYRNNP